MTNYETMERSLMKNLQEFSEFAVSFGVTNYYDLCDLMVDLWNFRSVTYQMDEKLANKITKKVKKELSINV